MGRIAKESHEYPAANINTVAGLIPHLCTLAYDSNVRKGNKLRPDMCAKCESPCLYGMKLLKLMKLDRVTFSGTAHCQMGQIRELVRTNCDLSMKRVLRRQKHGK